MGRTLPKILLGQSVHNCRAMTSTQKLDYGALNGGGFKDRLLEQFRRDTAPPLVEDAEPAEPELDPDHLERDRKLQELLSRRPSTQKSKDMTCDMAWMWHAMAVACKCGRIMEM